MAEFKQANTIFLQIVKNNSVKKTRGTKVRSACWTWGGGDACTTKGANTSFTPPVIQKSDIRVNSGQ